MALRRNLERESRYLLRGRNPTVAIGDGATGQRVRLVEAICRVQETRPEIEAGTEEARCAAIRLVWGERIALARPYWLFGKPSAADLDVVERRVAELLGVPPEEVAEAIKDHRPAAAV